MKDIKTTCSPNWCVHMAYCEDKDITNGIQGKESNNIFIWNYNGSHSPANNNRAALAIENNSGLVIE